MYAVTKQRYQIHLQSSDKNLFEEILFVMYCEFMWSGPKEIYFGLMDVYHQFCYMSTKTNAFSEQDIQLNELLFSQYTMVENQF